MKREDYDSLMDNGLFDSAEEYVNDLERRILELEELPTCEGCKWYSTGTWSECVSCSRNKLIIDHYCKTKDQQ